MGKWWEAYKARFADNLKHGASDGLRAAASGRSSGEVAKERRAKQRPRLDGTALREHLLKLEQRHHEKIELERARGNKNIIETTFEATYVNGLPVAVVFNNGAEPGRIDVYYGGAGNNPLDTPPEDYHGHIVIRQGMVHSWLEPGPLSNRNRLV